MNQPINDHLVLICGESTTGKSMSLQNIPDQERWVYLNCEAGKRLPFKNNFKQAVITNPLDVFSYFNHIKGSPDFDGIIIDTLTFLMDMYESKFVMNAANGQKAWGDFAQFYKTMMQDFVASSDKNVIFLAHTLTTLNEEKMMNETKVPVKGSLKNNGIEAYYSTVVATKKVPIKVLKNFQNDLLHISADEEELGFKHVFQTRLTKETVGERIRAPIGMFSREETYIDNDAYALMKRLHEYYQ